jgi:hypothetical protein
MYLLRNKIEGLVVPLACTVDYLGLRFECISLVPASLNSLAYGSDLNGVVYKNDDLQAEKMAQSIGQLLNLKPHFVLERAT